MQGREEICQSAGEDAWPTAVSQSSAGSHPGVLRPGPEMPPRGAVCQRGLFAFCSFDGYHPCTPTPCHTEHPSPSQAYLITQNGPQNSSRDEVLVSGICLNLNSQIRSGSSEVDSMLKNLDVQFPYSRFTNHSIYCLRHDNDVQVKTDNRLHEGVYCQAADNTIRRTLASLRISRTT